MSNHLNIQQNTLSTQNPIRWFREAASYIHQHRGKVCVVVFGGEALIQADFKHIIHDIALLKSLGIKLVLVHGARPQIDDNLSKQSITTPIHNHMRVTTQNSLRCVLDAVGSTRLEIEAALSMGLSNSPMYGARLDAVSGNFVIAKPFGVRDGIDFEYTGAVRSVDATAINKCLDNDQIVLLGPIGYSTTGEVFNLLAEQVAVKAAIALHADKLIFMGKAAILPRSSEKSKDIKKELLPNQALDVAHSILSEDDSLLELKRHFIGAAKACQQGVGRAHIISYTEDGALLKELYTRNGIGTLISSNRFEDIAPASFDDIGGLMELLAPLEDKGVLVRRTRETLENDIDHFAVIKRDGLVVGCAALYVYDQEGKDDLNTRSAEIASIAIHPNYQGASRGAQLLVYLEKQAESQGVNRLFVLTTQTAHWFLDQGYVEAGVDALPSHKQQTYNTSRASKVYVKVIA